MNKVFMKLFRLIIGQASPEIRKAICTMLNDLAVKAKATDNPWDDVMVDLAKAI
ncbi:hypothetical protein LCGC14_2603100, partial [marine sediment metagenome]